MQQIEMFDLPERQPMAHAQPVVKWLGGKRWILPLISEGIYRYLDSTGGHYVEPFLGGGAVALDLGLPRMRLSDLCSPLMIMYDVIRRDCDGLIALLDELGQFGTSDEQYYLVRAESFHGEPVEIAAQMIYLNKLCFNGVFRVNKSGRFNVPYGSPRQGDPATLFNFDGIRAAASALKTADLRCLDFRVALERAGAGDLVFADSPYQSTFTSYNKGGFTMDDQEALADLLFEAWQEGAVVLATNADHPEIRALYEWATITPTQEPRAANRNGKGRGKKPCLLIQSPGAEKLLGS